jgi:alkylation response protein AidB-like acyl-CoA dehydrogenase
VGKHYLLGEDYPSFDLLHWNGDVTNLPARWHREYLTELYRDKERIHASGIQPRRPRLPRGSAHLHRRKLPGPSARQKQDEGDELARRISSPGTSVLYKKGWVAPAWPVEYGGTGWTSTQRFIFSEETARADCIRLMPFGLAMVGPVIYTFGTPEQKAQVPAAHPVG